MIRRLQSIVDFRSDTVTKPCVKMYDAMNKAKIGDDVLQDDPSILALENKVCDMFNKPSSLFVPSGTMGNLISIGVQCVRGDEIIVGNGAHIFVYEGGGASAFMGVSLSTIPNTKDGSLNILDIEKAIRDDDIHYPKTTMITMENTHNTCGGRIVPQEKIKAIGNLAHQHNLKYHLDGARIMNASVASKISLSDIVQPFDTISFCLSKGLGCPVGSVILGSEEFIYKARRLRKALGGGMRQSGLLASAGLFALDHNIDRLYEDHDLAKTLAYGLEMIPGIDINLSSIDTNLVYFKLNENIMTPSTFIEKMAAHGVLLGGGYKYSNCNLRMVTHKDISARDVKDTLEIITHVVCSSSKK